VVSAALGATGLLGVLIRDRSDPLRPLGLPLTPGLSIALLVLALAAGGATAGRPAAKVFLLAASSTAVALVIGAGVAAAHQRPGPLGFTATAIVWWAIVFCYNLGLGIWMIPDHLEGPAWVWRRRPRGQPATLEDRFDAR